MQDHKRDCDIKKQNPYGTHGLDSSRIVTNSTYHNNGYPQKYEGTYHQNNSNDY